MTLVTNKKPCLLSAGLFLIGVLFSAVSWSAPGITVESSGPQYSTALYEEIVTDLHVKVQGGFVKIKRQWRDGQWHFNPGWADLALEGGDAETGPKKILRNHFSYERKNAQSTIYSYDARKNLQATTTGYRWTDKKGHWIKYDKAGFITQFLYFLANLRQPIQYIRFLPNILSDLLGVVLGIVGNKIMDGT